MKWPAMTDPADPARESGDSRIGPNGTPGAAYGPAEMSCEATRLMTAFKAGDAGAFDSLFQSLRARAFQVARSIVGSREDALDLTQEAFAKLYTARASYDPSQPFLPWFHRILRNACFSFLRKRGRMRKRSLHSLAEDGDQLELDLEDPGPAPSDGLEDAEQHAAFERAMARLSARDREILALRHFEELSYKDIASALDIPEGTVMSRLFHARRRLRECLDPALLAALDAPRGFREWPARAGVEDLHGR